MVAFNGNVRRVPCRLGRGPTFSILRDGESSFLLFFRGGAIARWNAAETAVTRTWLAFHQVGEMTGWPKPLVQSHTRRIVVHDDWTVWVWSPDGRTHQGIQSDAAIGTIAALPGTTDRIAVAYRNGRVDILDEQCQVVGSHAAAEAGTWDLCATASELFVGHQRSIGAVDFFGQPTRSPIALPDMVLHLDNYGGMILAGLNHGLLGRVDRGVFESLGIGLALGWVEDHLIVLRKPYELERVGSDGVQGGSVRCSAIDQPFALVSAPGLRGVALVGRGAVSWLRHGDEQTRSAWAAPSRIRACVPLDSRSLVIAGDEELWILEGYLEQ
ncbi:MAG: hypothetical protein IPM79_19320 [Polyangiaceae bacterium]|jgi:hypothetical protein|nr:hypothetical protein [Polyangiaceae bacterium]